MREWGAASAGPARASNCNSAHGAICGSSVRVLAELATGFARSRAYPVRVLFMDGLLERARASLSSSGEAVDVFFWRPRSGVGGTQKLQTKHDPRCCYEHDLPRNLTTKANVKALPAAQD